MRDGSVEHISLIKRDAMRAQHSQKCPFAGSGVSFAPPGRKREKSPNRFPLIRFPRVTRRAAVRPRRSTRGYTPPPLRG